MFLIFYCANVPYNTIYFALLAFFFLLMPLTSLKQTELCRLGSGQVDTRSHFRENVSLILLLCMISLKSPSSELCFFMTSSIGDRGIKPQSLSLARVFFSFPVAAPSLQGGETPPPHQAQ